MRQSAKIFLNIGLIYGRMALSVFLSLIATRLLLQRLGFEDFGVLAVLGATGALLNIFTDSLTAGTQRHLAFYLGHENKDHGKRIFNTSLVLFLVIGFALFLASFALTDFILSFLHLPAERLGVAAAVFRLIVLNLSAAILLTPYQALIWAHQEIEVVVRFEIIKAFLTLAGAIGLFYLPGDPLLNYQFILFLITLIAIPYFIHYCRSHHPEITFDLRKCKRRELFHIVDFAGWTLLTGVSQSVRLQGSQVLLNFFFGPVMNASYALANQLGSYLSSVGSAIYKSVQPAIVTMTGKNQTKEVKQFSATAGRYFVLAVSLFFVPLELETPAFLRLWLGDYPYGAEAFLRLILLWRILPWFASAYEITIQAHGDLKSYALSASLIEFGILGASASAFYFFHASPNALPLITFAGAFLMAITRVAFACRAHGWDFTHWITETVFPALAIIALSLILPLAIHFSMPENLLRLFIVTALYGIGAFCLTWCMALRSWEGEYFKAFGRDIHKKLGRLYA